MSLMIRIPSRNTDRRTADYSTADRSELSWQDWQFPQEETLSKTDRRFSAACSPGGAGSDGASLRQRLQALTRQLRRRSGSSSLPRASSGQLRDSGSSSRLSVMSKFSKFASTLYKSQD
ncbi:hypothetical protein ISF_07970 [Cordyceps fumosorosea ARSEF 2679]|uniref:Uncharacterized protein n=1 Tax=Cordyceps fumosorosea (strain ARSEF 2679) TaxID=1081104 RepID=A0A167NE71_CORFA|nr:hypothetical protein ISF_07970 [Cordyceps fumosorosea ARSEF 2679]OAA55459.1 hypothetical protein ISF_07970 [Cordyceps fumosorosea ARSEF 2679]